MRCIACRLAQGSNTVSRLRPTCVQLRTLICAKPALKSHPARLSVRAVAIASRSVRGWRSSTAPTTPIAYGFVADSVAIKACVVVAWTHGAQASTKDGMSTDKALLSGALQASALAYCWSEL